MGGDQILSGTCSDCQKPFDITNITTSVSKRLYIFVPNRVQMSTTLTSALCERIPLGPLRQCLGTGVTSQDFAETRGPVIR